MKRHIWSGPAFAFNEVCYASRDYDPPTAYRPGEWSGAFRLVAEPIEAVSKGLEMTGKEFPIQFADGVCGTARVQEVSLDIHATNFRPRLRDYTLKEIGQYVVLYYGKGAMQPMPNDERSAFIRAILATPEDMAPRLVFADWLEENGEEELGRKMRAVALATY